MLLNCLGIAFMILLAGLMFAGLVENYDNSCCYLDYLRYMSRSRDCNPYYNCGRRWRYHGFSP